MAYPTNPNHPKARAIAMQLLIVKQLPVQTVAMAYPHGGVSTAHESYGWGATSIRHLIIKIGDPSRYVNGVVTYKIHYSLRNVISFYEADELYWNINGTGWQQKFGHVSANIHIPNNIANTLKDKQMCYSGSFKSTEQNCQISRDDLDNETVVSTNANNIPPGGNLSFVLGFEKGTFNVDQSVIWWKRFKMALSITFLLLPPVLIFIILYRKWERLGKDARSRGTIITQYTPPKGFNALTSDILMKESLSTKAISATIIELAIRGHVAIHETTTEKGLLKREKTEYELELLKQLDPENDASEQQILHMIFGENASIGTRKKLKDLSSTLYIQVDILGKDTSATLTEKGYFRADPIKIRNKYIILGVGLMIGGGVFGGMTITLLGSSGVALILGLSLAGVITLVFAHYMPARTENGVEVHDYLLGLKSYIKLAEADRLKFLQSPEGIKQYGNPKDQNTRIKLFEKLLPYAIIFGLEKDWAKEFENIYSQPPSWYRGNWTTFNTIYLVNSIDGFESASNVNFAPPQSSGSSGFGGGGFSGGGGGGGGGGGW